MELQLKHLIDMCAVEVSKDPKEILDKLMAEPFCPIHGPVHHTLVGAALLTAYKNAGGEIDLEVSITEMMNRAKQVPGAACGYWGACGAGISTGMFLSIITDNGPLAEGPWGLSNLMTSKALHDIGEVGGPRCCKRNSSIAIIAAVEYVKDNLGIEMDKHDIVCSYFNKNEQCIGSRCPFRK